LAPIANAAFNNGEIAGTVVVKSANPEWMELEWVPYHGLATSGCQGWDTSWSCSDDTYRDSNANEAVVFPAPEAGFFQIDSESYSFKDTEITGNTYNRTSPTHRIWYSFQPATVAPGSKPLVVFFNGGPGGATSTGLFSFNTAPQTLDPDWVGSSQIAPNPNSWTQFANLLYIDPPGTGFSYPMPTATGATPSVGIDIFRDAAIVLQVVLRFLDRHPSLECNQVMLVGESFGGTRATTMLNHLLQVPSGYGLYQDSALQSDLENHFSNVCPGQNATQFGSQVLIEPVVAGSFQELGSPDYNPPDAIGCVPNGDEYQCNQTDPNDPNYPDGGTWYWERIHTAATNLTNLATLRTALGVSPTTIAWFWAKTRVGAYSHGSADEKYLVVSTPEMDSLFGTLSAGDSYFVVLNKTVAASYPNGDGTTAINFSDVLFGEIFLEAVETGDVKTFITHADHDEAVNVMAIPRAFLDPKSPYPVLVSSCTVTNIYPNSFRPAVMTIVFGDGTSQNVRFPEYVNAGHSVSQRMPAELLYDVMQWYGSK